MSNTDNNWDALMAGVQAPIFASDMDVYADAVFLAMNSMLHDYDLLEPERCSCAQVLTDMLVDMRRISSNLKQLNELENG